MAGERGMLVSSSPGLVDILDRILDKGLVVAGDIRISLANVELLTIQIRLIVCSIDKAEQIGLNWWRYDRNLVYEPREQETIVALQQRIAQLEAELSTRKDVTEPTTSDQSERPDIAL